MAGWFFKKKSISSIEENIEITLQAKHNFIPTQVSGDTIENPSLHTLPTLGKLLTVRYNEHFSLPDDELVQWLLVKRDFTKERNGDINENGGLDEVGDSISISSDNENDTPLWGFIPKRCLTDESLMLIESKCSSCGKFEKAKQESNLMVLKLAKTEQQLHESLEKNKLLQERLERYQDEHTRITKNMHQLIEQLVDKGKQIEENKKHIESLTTSLEKEKENVKLLEMKLQQQSLNDSHSSEHLLDGTESELNFVTSPRDETLDELEDQLRQSSITPIGDLMLSCTLCSERISITDMESHSVKCSSGNKAKNGKKTSDSPAPGLLIATVTCSLKDSIASVEQTLYKIICKTTIAEYKKTLLTCERTTEDLSWLRKSLESLHPNLVIPPLIFKEELTDSNLREIQRFLSRICAHKVFKADSLVRSFFCATNKELEKLKNSFQKQCPTYLLNKKPAIEVVDKDGVLYRTQVYIGKLIVNLESIVSYLKTNSDGSFIDGLSQSFLALSNNEPNDTYLKNVSKGLSSIIHELENKKNIIYDEGMFIEDLESILEFIKSADELLFRIECAINTFLYWEEEVKVFEEMKTEGFMTTSNGTDITHKWAEASSNCRTAKEELERMCRDLSDELSVFDIRKEQELKQIFLEYAQSRCDTFEKLQSKWFGVKLMMQMDIVSDVRAIDFKAQ